MTIPLTRASLESAVFWDETICLVCGTVQTDSMEPGEPCQECESPDTTKAGKLAAFLSLLEDEQ